jgi:hypothetical protein
MWLLEHYQYYGTFVLRNVAVSNANMYHIIPELQCITFTSLHVKFTMHQPLGSEKKLSSIHRCAETYVCLLLKYRIISSS